MKYTKTSIGRIFLVKFEHGDDLIEKIKELVLAEEISFGTILFLGALKSADIVTGPKGIKLPPEPVFVSFDDSREVVGFGTIVNSDKTPKIHLHAALGKGEKTLAGCLRENCETFITIEALITELSDIKVSRKKDEKTGLELLSF